MKYILAFSLLFLTGCGDEELDSACQGEAKYEFLLGNWTNTFYVGNQNYEHRLRLNFGDPNKDELEVIYSCRDNNGNSASVSRKPGYTEHSPEQISIFDTGNMKPEDRSKDLECEEGSFGGARYNLEFSGECIILDSGNGKLEFKRGL